MLAHGHSDQDYEAYAYALLRPHKTFCTNNKVNYILLLFVPQFGKFCGNVRGICLGISGAQLDNLIHQHTMNKRAPGAKFAVLYN